MLDKIVYAAIAVGVTVIGAGITLIIHYEGRLSKLEAQVSFAFGATAISDPSPKAKTDPDGEGEARPSSHVTDSSKTDLGLALASSCTKLIDTYHSIVSGTSALGSYDKERLEAISSQLNKLGCTNAVPASQPLQ